MSNSAISIQKISHRYGATFVALDQVSLEIERGKLFALLGPNGSGKTTLFKLLSTQIKIQSGRIQVGCYVLPQERMAVRQELGIVFQSPSLDRELTVWENLLTAGPLYGLGGAALNKRAEALLSTLNLNSRRAMRVKELSGGLARRVEIAKSLLHEPSVLLMDEPTTGLDPGARHQFWQEIRGLSQLGATVFFTTHWMEEAEQADHLAILANGRVVADGAPAALKSEIPGSVVWVESQQALELQRKIANDFSLPVALYGNKLWFQVEDNSVISDAILSRYRSDIQSITIAQPTLEDVYLTRTGERFWTKSEPSS